MRTVRVAAIQATPVILDAEASVAKAVRLLERGRRRRARELAVLPETFVPLYPSNALGQGRGGVRRLGRALGAAVGERRRRARPADRRARRGLRASSTSTASIGVNERESDRPGSLYNALLTARPGGPAAQAPQADADACTSGCSTASAPATTCSSVDTPLGRIGGLICWENRMPLARWAVYQGGPQIWVAPTADDTRRLARLACGTSRSSRARSSSRRRSTSPRSAFPDDFPVAAARARRASSAAAARRSSSRPGAR